MSMRRLARMLPAVFAVMTAVSFTILPSSSRILSELFGKLSSAMTATLAMAVGFSAALFLYMSRLWDRSAENELEEARFTRQLTIVEDRLKKLELLRKADLETLVKKGPRDA